MRRLLALSAAVLVLGGCSGHPAAHATSAPPAAAASGGFGSAPAPASAAPAGRTVIAGRGDTLSVLTPTLQRSGDVVVLTLPVRVDKTSLPNTPVALTSYFSRSLTSSTNAPLLIDEAAGRAYEAAVKGPDCTCSGPLLASEGQTALVQAAYTGVPATVTRLSVQAPLAGVFLDVPVTDGAAPPLAISDPGTSVARDLTALIEDPGLLTSRSPKQVDLNLAADVLFRIDKATLTPAATAAIAAAVTQLHGYAPGRLTITGHTDSTGTDAHNQKLSEARAKTVATALRADLPDARWPKSVSGKGETQPIASNGTAAGRQLNRRVTITYQVTAAAPQPSSAAPATGALPATKGVVATASAGAEVTLPGGAVRFTAGPAVRRGDRLLVTLTAHNEGSRYLSLSGYLSGGFWHRSGTNLSWTPYDDSGVRLLDGATSRWPLQYEVEPFHYACLCDPDLAGDFAGGADRQLVLWFPAPPAAETTTTIDVPDKFRLTDVPIS